MEKQLSQVRKNKLIACLQSYSFSHKDKVVIDLAETLPTVTIVLTRARRSQGSNLAVQ